MLTNKRIGKWCWALSGEEGLTAAAVGRSEREGSRLSVKVKRRHLAMLEKQKKLSARVVARSPHGSSGWLG